MLKPHRVCQGNLSDSKKENLEYGIYLREE